MCPENTIIAGRRHQKCRKDKQLYITRVEVDGFEEYGVKHAERATSFAERRGYIYKGRRAEVLGQIPSSVTTGIVINIAAAERRRGARETELRMCIFYCPLNFDLALLHKIRALAILKTNN